MNYFDIDEDERVERKQQRAFNKEFKICGDCPKCKRGLCYRDQAPSKEVEVTKEFMVLECGYCGNRKNIKRPR